MRRKENIQVFSKEWFLVHQKKLLAAVNTDLGKQFFRVDNCIPDGKKIIKIFPNCFTWVHEVLKSGKIVYSTCFFTDDHFAKRLYHGLKPVWNAMHFMDGLFLDKWFPEFSFGFNTLGPIYPAAGAVSPCDGYVAREVGGSPESFSTLRSGAGTTKSETGSAAFYIYLLSGSSSNQWISLRRCIFMFDTSSIDSTCVISSAVFSLYGSATPENNLSLSTSHFAISVVGVSPASTSSLAIGDYETFSTTRYASDLQAGSYSSSAYNDITFNSAGIAGIPKGAGAIAKIGTRMAVDLDNGTPNWVSSSFSRLSGYFSDNGSNKPKLVVTYVTDITLADTSTLSDSMDITVSVPMSDTLTLSDSMLAGQDEQVSDSMTLSETLSIENQVSDSMTLSETLSIENQVSDSMTLSETLSISASAGPSDTLTLSEQLAIENRFGDTLSLGESLSITEIIPPVIQGIYAVNQGGMLIDYIITENSNAVYDIVGIYVKGMLGRETR